MENEYNRGNIVMEREYADTRFAEGQNGYIMIIPVYNKAVPACWVENVMKAAEAIADVHTAISGRVPEKVYVDATLSVSLDRKAPPARKYKLNIAIVIEEGDGIESRDYAIGIPILPTDNLFAEVRQCFLDEFEALAGKAPSPA